MVTIYHNPRCSKSREGLQLLEEFNVDFKIIKYLNENLTKSELLSIVEKLKMKPIEIVRQKEAVWIENFKGKDISNDEIIDILILHPKLIERPIVVNGDKAVIARPPSNIEAIL
ncbi:MAG: arsenate reductase (glutaredoxin) [Flavobacterium sp.]|nr:MAG: arsenate reductase (glutaredoxin) [Flavobacterium sp.]